MTDHSMRAVGQHPLSALVGQIVDVYPQGVRNFRGALIEVDTISGFLCIDQLAGLEVWVALDHIVAVELAWSPPAAAEATS